MRRKNWLLILLLVFVLSLAGCGTADHAAADVGAAGQQAEDTGQNREDGAEAGGGSQNEDTEEPGTVEVHFLDVGQGDSTLIKCGGAAMLIDAADGNKGTAIQNYLQHQGISKLDYLVLTHPDSDHIGAAPVIITKFEIGQVFMSNFEKDNKTFDKLTQALGYKSLKYETPEVGSTYRLGSAEFTILAPNREYSDPNNASIALLLQNGENRFLFTGDAEEQAEGDILENGQALQADVFQAGHHGAKTSNGREFIEEVDPEYVVISCAEGNSYGHPHAEVLNHLRDMDIKVFRTDEQGTVVAISDGSKITWNCSPSESWLAGEPKGSSGDADAGKGAGKAPGDADADKGAGKASGDADADKGAGKASGKGEAEAKQDEGTGTKEEIMEEAPQQDTIMYILNVKTKKFHIPSCSYLPTSNRLDSTQSREELINQGYDPCKKCYP